MNAPSFIVMVGAVVHVQIGQCVQAITTEKKEQAYVVQIPSFAKFVCGLGENISEVDIDVGKRVAISESKFSIAVRRYGMDNNCRKLWLIQSTRL